MSDPGEPVIQDAVSRVRARPEYLDRARSPLAAIRDHLGAAVAGPHRYLATLVYVARAREIDRGYRTVSRFACFSRAVRLGRRLRRSGVEHVHAHFAHDPALVAHLLHRLTGLQFSFTAHARDLYQVPVPALLDRIRSATTVVTCCGANVDYITSIAPDAADKVRLVHHGVDADAFRPLERDAAHDPPRIVSVGRLVEKKGFTDLIAACAELGRDGSRFRCAIYGDGPLRPELAQMIRQFDLDDHVTLEGERTQEEIRGALQRADVFALTPVVTDDGDRDGIPNALLEAMACGLPTIATAVGGNIEVIKTDRTGLLVRLDSAAELALAIRLLITDETRRSALGAAARQYVVKHHAAAITAAAYGRRYAELVNW
jgi:glycosyltransferase involved in cell wall biosynthesis